MRKSLFFIYIYIYVDIDIHINIQTPLLRRHEDQAFAATLRSGEGGFEPGSIWVRIFLFFY